MKGFFDYDVTLAAKSTPKCGFQSTELIPQLTGLGEEMRQKRQKTKNMISPSKL